MRRSLLFLIAFLIAPWSYAQERPAAPPQNAQASGPLLRSTTRAVVLDVTVTDQRGNPVGNLTRKDFTVLENDTAQSIASFESSTTLQQKTAQAPSRTVILIDELNTQFIDIAYARYSVEKYLKRASGRQLEQPAQLLALTDHGLVLACDYTRNGGELLRALEQLPAIIPFKLGLGASALGDRVNISLGALEEIARASAHSGQRTTVVWVSPGFPIVTPMNMDPDDREKLLDALRKMSDMLLRSRVTVYSVDPRAVFNDGANRAVDAMFSSSYSASTVFGDLALERLALETGGRAFYGRNDVDNLVAASILQSNTFYTLSYYPSDTDYNGQFRKIHIQVNRSGLKPLTRLGYYAVAEPSAPGSQEIALAVKRALLSPLAYRGIPVSIAGVAASGGSHLAVNVEIDGNALNWEPAPNGHLEFSVMLGIADFAKQDVLYSHIGVFHGESSSDKLDPHVQKKVVIAVNVPANSKSSLLRLAVEDPKNGRVGTAEIAR